MAGSFITGSTTSIVSGKEVPEITIPEETVALDEFLLNLEPKNNKQNYIRLELSLSSKRKDGLKTINKNLDKIRDSIIHKVSRLSVEDVYNEEVGTSRMKDLLKQTLNEMFDDTIVHEVYITNIVVQ